MKLNVFRWFREWWQERKIKAILRRIRRNAKC
jgi:hypothetical protein